MSNRKTAQLARSSRKSTVDRDPIGAVETGLLSLLSALLLAGCAASHSSMVGPETDPMLDLEWKITVEWDNAQQLQDPARMGRVQRDIATLVKHHRAAVRAALRDSDPKRRAIAAAALGFAEDREAAPAIAAQLKDPSPDVRRFSAQALGMMGAREELPAIRELLSDPLVEVRQGAMEALACLAGEQGQDLIPHALKELQSKDDASAGLRLAAVRLLAKLRAREALAAIAELANRDPVPLVRLVAVAALGWIGDSEAAPRLVPLLRDPEPRIREAAAYALRQIAGEDLGVDPEKWETWLSGKKKHD